jgi:hypothetical protein
VAVDFGFVAYGREVPFEVELILPYVKLVDSINYFLVIHESWSPLFRFDLFWPLLSCHGCHGRPLKTAMPGSADRYMIHTRAVGLKKSFNTRNHARQEVVCWVCRPGRRTGGHEAPAVENARIPPVSRLTSMMIHDIKLN